MALQRSRDVLWRKRVAAIRSVWDAAREGNPTALHQLRVATRRIREALPVVSDSQRSRRIKRTRRKMRTLTRVLGLVRERHVSMSLLAGLEKKHPEDRPAIEAVREAIAAEQRDSQDELGRRLAAAKLEKLVKNLTRVTGHARQRGNLRQRGRKRGASNERKWPLAVTARVVRRAKQLSQAIEQAGALYALGRLHGVRVLTKKLRYALEVGSEARIYRWQSAVRALKEIQDILGRLQDREALVERVRDVPVSHSDSAASAAVDRLTRLLEGDIRQDHAKFVNRRDPLLQLCAMVRQQASHAIPIGRPAPTRAALRPAQRAAKLHKPPRVVLPLPRTGERVAVREQAARRSPSP